MMGGHTMRRGVASPAVLPGDQLQETEKVGDRISQVYLRDETLDYLSHICRI